jgi:hypothetical protein
MRRKGITVAVFLLLGIAAGFCQNGVEVEKLGSITEMKRTVVEGFGSGPYTIVVDEVKQKIEIPEGVSSRSMIVDYSPSGKLSVSEGAFEPSNARRFFQLGQWLIGSTEGVVTIRRGEKDIVYLGPDVTQTGLCFILRMQNEHYIVFFVKKDEAIGAADTTGKVYTSQEALTVLKALDPAKFERSRLRARELGLESQFLSGKALVWGDTYYNTPDLLEAYWGKSLYPSGSEQIHYDLHGNGYMAAFYSDNGHIWAAAENADSLLRIEIKPYSEIYKSYTSGMIANHSSYVGFGGNIYFYVAGEEFTELFRIRRTWGKPDFYAMAVNGYTDDGYGKYVKQVLSKLSKEDLRLLRNHLFALYGYVFQSEDLSSYFDKQVWYLPVSGVTTAAITLPAERQALLDLVQAEEKKR